MMPSGAADTGDIRQSLPGKVSGGSGGEIQHENAGIGVVATRLSEAQNTEGTPDRTDDKAAHVSTSIAISV